MRINNLNNRRFLKNIVWSSKMYSANALYSDDDANESYMSVKEWYKDHVDECKNPLRCGSIHYSRKK